MGDDLDLDTPADEMSDREFVIHLKEIAISIARLEVESRESRQLSRLEHLKRSVTGTPPSEDEEIEEADKKLDEFVGRMEELADETDRFAATSDDDDPFRGFQ